MDLAPSQVTAKVLTSRLVNHPSIFVTIKLTADTVFSSLSSVALTAPTMVKVPSNLKDIHAPWSQHGLLPSKSQPFQSENRGVHPNEEHRAGPSAMTQGDIPLCELPASTGRDFYKGLKGCFRRIIALAMSTPHHSQSVVAYNAESSVPAILPKEFN